MSVDVRNPEKLGEGLKNSYINYEIVSKTSENENDTTIVKRRYQDFILLHNCLQSIESSILPPLPSTSHFGSDVL